MTTPLDRILAKRLATQGVTSTAFATVEDALGTLVCVQAQDAPLARWSLAMRVRGATDATIMELVASGKVVRTHILRPTWHYVLAEDLRWLLDLTSPQVEASLAGRHRQLGLESRFVERAHEAIYELLHGGRSLTRAEVGEELGDGRLAGERLGHVLMLAELRGLICSGPPRGPHHTYAVVDERIPATPRRSRDAAARELVGRFFAGHGPASAADLARWTVLTKTEVTAVVQELGLTSIDFGGERYWYDSSTPRRAGKRSHALLLPTFDEAFLTYRWSGFPRIAGHPRGTQPHSFAEAGGGVVICDLCDVGWWKRSRRGRSMRVEVAVSPNLGSAQLAAIEASAMRLAEVFDDRLEFRRE